MQLWTSAALGILVALSASAASSQERIVLGELLSLDPAARTGELRQEGTDETIPFVVAPSAVVRHRGAYGDLRDLEPGQRLIVHLAPGGTESRRKAIRFDEKLAVYPEREQRLHVAAIDQRRWPRVQCQLASQDKSVVLDGDYWLEISPATRFWKAGLPATLANLQVGDQITAQTIGVGLGKVRIATDLFLDDESRLKLREEQAAIHLRRLREEGMPAAIESHAAGKLQVSLFPEAEPLLPELAKARKVRIAPAGVDRQPIAQPTIHDLVSTNRNDQGRFAATIAAPTSSTSLPERQLVRIWIER